MRSILKITALVSLLFVGIGFAQAQDAYEYATIFTFQPEGTSDNTRDVYIEYSERPKEIIELGTLRTKVAELTEAKLKQVGKKAKEGWEVIAVTEAVEGVTYHLRKKK